MSDIMRTILSRAACGLLGHRWRPAFGGIGQVCTRLACRGLTWREASDGE